MTFGLGAGALVSLFVATTASVVGLFLLRPPPRRFLVSATLLWQRAIEQRKRRPRDRRFWVSLLASLVVVWALAAALADPSWRDADELIVIVIDNSATMATRTHAGTTRLEQAVERARSMTRSAGRVLLADTCGRIATREFVSRHAALETLSALDGCLEAQPERPRVEVPEGSRGVLITDGVAASAPPGFETISVFERAENVAIAAFAVRPVANPPGAFEAYLAMVNQGDVAHDVEVVITGSGSPLSGRERIAPGEKVARAIALPDLTAGGVEARIRVDGDAFPLDDVAYDVLPPSVVRVRLRSQHPALLRALQLARDIEPSTPDSGGPAVVVASNSEAVARTASLEFAGGGASVTLTDSIEIRSGHPVLRGVSADDLIARSATRLQPGADERWLARAGETPLILVREAHPRRVRIALSLEDSAITRRPGFPVLFANAVRWIAGNPGLAKSAAGDAETSVPVESVLGPGGELLPSVTLARRTFFEAHSTGLFTARLGGVSSTFGADLAHAAARGPNESGLPAPGPERPARGRASPEGWRVLLALALAVAVAERWAFVRRVAQ